MKMLTHARVNQRNSSWMSMIKFPVDFFAHGSKYSLSLFISLNITTVRSTSWCGSMTWPNGEMSKLKLLRSRLKLVLRSQRLNRKKSTKLMMKRLLLAVPKAKRISRRLLAIRRLPLLLKSRLRWKTKSKWLRLRRSKSAKTSSRKWRKTRRKRKRKRIRILLVKPKL